MSNSVLLAYATKYGSTREVAEAIAGTLRESGLEVDMQPARQVRSLENFSAVLLGAPLFMYRWHKDARRFLTRHRSALSKLPVAIFALGPSFDGDEKEWVGAREQIHKELDGYPWLKPLEVEVMGGKFDPADLGFPFKTTLKDIPAADLRDWKAIEKWAKGLVEKIR